MFHIFDVIFSFLMVFLKILDTRQALKLLERIKLHLKDSEAAQLSPSVGDDLNTLISVLDSPVFHSILNIQVSLLFLHFVILNRVFMYVWLFGEYLQKFVLNLFLEMFFGMLLYKGQY